MRLGICNALDLAMVSTAQLLPYRSSLVCPLVLPCSLIYRIPHPRQQPEAPARLACTANTPAGAPDSVQHPGAQVVRIPAGSVPVEAGSRTGSAVELGHRGQMGAARAAVMVGK
jgi:hypothetical protein